MLPAEKLWGISGTLYTLKKALFFAPFDGGIFIDIYGIPSILILKIAIMDF